MRDYQMVSPSLDGVLRHDSMTYENIRRPVELYKILDGSSSSNHEKIKSTGQDQKALENYFHDLYGVFMKRLSYFVIESESNHEDKVKLQAMLQEMIKVKNMMCK